jgi:hypothetical protein
MAVLNTVIKLLLGVMYRSNRMQAYQTWLGKTENLISQLNINCMGWTSDDYWRL